jgi:hypothetical protein
MQKIDIVEVLSKASSAPDLHAKMIKRAAVRVPRNSPLKAGWMHRWARPYQCYAASR